ncbi:unnamed protein product, partial [Mesorhabditis spiculigera]
MSSTYDRHFPPLTKALELPEFDFEKGDLPLTAAELDRILATTPIDDPSKLDGTSHERLEAFKNLTIKMDKLELESQVGQA